MADPEQYRTKEQVAEWRRRDPIENFAGQLIAAGVLSEQERAEMDAAVIARVDEAVAFADESPFPEPASLYDDVYVLGDQLEGWWSVDSRSAGVHRGEEERELDEAELGPHDQYDEAIAAALEGAEEADAEPIDPETGGWIPRGED
jgi:hypothetical protein